MAAIRAFIAIPLPADVQAAVGSLSQIWSDKIPAHSVRWVKPHLMHITLRFLGDTEIASLLGCSCCIGRNYSSELIPLTLDWITLAVSQTTNAHALFGLDCRDNLQAARHVEARYR